MSWPDAGGLAGVFLILAAYTGATAGKFDPKRPASLLANFVGASLILLSLAHDFNLSAVAMEGAWAVISLVGLARLSWRRLRA